MGEAVPTLDLTSVGTARTSAILTGVYVYGSILDVARFRSVTLFISQAGAGAANELSIVPVGSPLDVQPAAGDDSWFAFGVNDGSVSANDLGVTVATGADYTAQPNWGRVTVYPMELRLKAHTNTTDKIRVKVKLDVSDIKWLQLACADVDASGTLSTAVITYVGTV